MKKQNLGREFNEELEDSEDDRWGEWVFNVMFPIVKMERLKKEQKKSRKKNKELEEELKEVKSQIEAEWEEIQTWANNVKQPDFIKEYKLLIEAKKRGMNTANILKRFVDIVSKETCSV